MKKLDKLIIKSFIGPFAATFFITLFVLIMQFFWLWIDEFVGKGVDAFTLMKFIWYQSAVLIPLALPLSILLSSLMTFGNLGETFELVAIKSAGISLLRFMRPLFFLVVLIGVGAFLFSNYIIPIANLKSRTILSDIIVAKPAVNIKEGVFYKGLDGFALKIGKKEKGDSIIRDVILYEQGNPLQDNFIVAKSGIMKTSPDKRFLNFVLRDGIRYQERGNREDSTTEYIRLAFKEYTKQFDISANIFKLTSDSSSKEDEKLYSMRQLNQTIDSIKKLAVEERKGFSSSILNSLPILQFRDSVVKEKVADSLLNFNTQNLAKLMSDSGYMDITSNALMSIQNTASNYKMSNDVIYDKEKSLWKFEIEWHRKLAESAACIVLFIIGAPLGSIIRKGGLGTPLIFAIVFFIIYFFISTRGIKLSKEGVLPSTYGVWMATYILLPVGFFITFKALRDSNLFSKEFYYRLKRKVVVFFNKKTA